MEGHMHEGNESTDSSTAASSSSTNPSFVECNTKFRNLIFREKLDPSIQHTDTAAHNLPFMDVDASNLEEEIPKSLLSMGFNYDDDGNGWNNEQISKKSLSSLLTNMIRKEENTDVNVRIGDTIFDCHLMLLQCHSELVRKLNKVVLIELPEQKVSCTAFSTIYKWMSADEPPVLKPEGILELSYAANFLEIPKLIKKCWHCLVECFKEDKAVMIYMQARKYGDEITQQLMLQSICKCFLTLVASEDFLQLSVKELCTLLSSNTIGVNSEIEVFMAAVLWLSHVWDERQLHIVDVFKTVRFSLMPEQFLVMLYLGSSTNEINRSVSHPVVKRMLTDALVYLQGVDSQLNGNLTILKIQNCKSPNQRNWIFDKQCPYHSCRDCNNMINISYKSFLDYLEHIRGIGKDYWHSVEMLDAVKSPCGIHSEGHSCSDQSSEG